MSDIFFNPFRTVAEKLKTGQSIDPETYMGVTVMVLNLVNFHDLASRSSALQGVLLLNELYTQLDEVIIDQEVFKVSNNNK